MAAAEMSTTRRAADIGAATSKSGGRAAAGDDRKIDATAPTGRQSIELADPSAFDERLIATKDVERRTRAPTIYSAIWRGALVPSACESPGSVSSGAQGKA